MMGFGGGGSSGGGGGGTSTTTSEASLVPELRPSAKAGGEQIELLQKANPLEPFGSPSIQQIPGLAPFTLGGFQLASMTPYSTPAEQALSQLVNPAASLTNQVLSLFGQQDPTQMAIMNRLAPGMGTAEMQSPWNNWGSWIPQLSPVFAQAPIAPPSIGAPQMAFAAPAGVPPLPSFETLTGPVPNALPATPPPVALPPVAAPAPVTTSTTPPVAAVNTPGWVDPGQATWTSEQAKMMLARGVPDDAVLSQLRQTPTVFPSHEAWLENIKGNMLPPGQLWGVPADRGGYQPGTPF